MIKHRDADEESESRETGVGACMRKHDSIHTLTFLPPFHTHTDITLAHFLTRLSVRVLSCSGAWHPLAFSFQVHTHAREWNEVSLFKIDMQGHTKDIRISPLRIGDMTNLDFSLIYGLSVPRKGGIH